MKYFELTPNDQRYTNWLFYRDTDRIRLRDLYTDLQCPVCRKLDETAALAQGIEADVRLMATDDYVISSDNFIVISARLLHLFASNGVSGFRTYPIPGDDRYVVAWPQLLVPTDKSRAGIEIQGPVCPKCGRPRETCFTPILASLRVPEDPMALFASEIWVEKSRGKMTWFTAAEPLVDLLRAARITGVTYNPV